VSLGEPEVTTNQVQDKLRALLQSEFICQSVITSQGVVQPSSEPASVSAVSATGKSDVIWKPSATWVYLYHGINVTFHVSDL